MLRMSLVRRRVCFIISPSSAYLALLPARSKGERTLGGKLELAPIRRHDEAESLFLSCKGSGQMRQGRKIAIGDLSVAMGRSPMPVQLFL